MIPTKPAPWLLGLVTAALGVAVGLTVWLTRVPPLPHSRPSPATEAAVTLAPLFERGPDWKAPLSGAPRMKFFFPEIMGAGCALFDFDRDGALDVYLVQGAGARPESADLSVSPVRNRLWRQSGRGQFEDRSHESGLDFADIGMGVAIGDVNNDGWPDVFLANYGADRLCLNQRDGTFQEVTAAAGIRDLNWGSSACFLDFDRDGWLDLCVANYLDYDPGYTCPDAMGQLDYCNPKLFHGIAARLYRNESGAGLPAGQAATQPRFRDVSRESGIGQKPGPGLGIMPGDFNGDRWPDLFVANDGAASHLWINQQNGTFTEEAIPRSVAYDNQGRPQAGMGIALADIDSDRHPDLLVTHLRGENNGCYLNRPEFGFTEESTRMGLGRPSFPYTGFGTVFLDLELDGDLDLAVVNGGVRRPKLGMVSESQKSETEFWMMYGERNQLFVNQGPSQFQEVAADSQPFCVPLNVARGLAAGDVDNDGDLDLLVSEATGAARLFWNRAERHGHWLSVQAIEPQLGRRDAYGAEITVHAGERHWTNWVNPGGSYLASSDPRVHFGLGPAQRVSKVEVVWPNGDAETFEGGAVDRFLQLEHGAGQPRQ